MPPSCRTSPCRCCRLVPGRTRLWSARSASCGLLTGRCPISSTSSTSPTPCISTGARTWSSTCTSWRRSASGANGRTRPSRSSPGFSKRAEWRTKVAAERWTAEINTDVAHPARMYDYYLGGKDNFPADREAADQALAASPAVRDMARQNRAFLQRVVRFLARDAGIRQFIDIGAGLPTQGNVHEIAQAITPDARVVYVDNDPIVVVHSDALLAGHNTTAIKADLREPNVILEHPEVREVIDLDQPVAVLLVAVLHFLQDADDPVGVVARLRDAMAAGSYLAISHG